jgi:hypothetical protein
LDLLKVIEQVFDHRLGLCNSPPVSPKKYTIKHVMSQKGAVHEGKCRPENLPE